MSAAVATAKEAADTIHAVGWWWSGWGGNAHAAGQFWQDAYRVEAVMSADDLRALEAKYRALAEGWTVTDPARLQAFAEPYRTRVAHGEYARQCLRAADAVASLLPSPAA